jgi:transcriptional regulator with XRE-family HTH domain
MGKTSNRRKSGGSPELAARIALLSRTLWGGNRSKMAKDLGVSQPVLWRVLEGQQPPPGSLVESIARHQDVSLAWLFRGDGDPSERRSAENRAVPIAKAALPGSPADFKGLLSGECCALPPPAPSRYWLELGVSEPLLRAGLQLRPRDLLLIETDQRWFPEPEGLFEDLCVVRFDVRGQKKRKLGRVSHVQGSDDEGPSRIEVDTFDLRPDPRSIESRVIVRNVHGRPRKIEILYEHVETTRARKVKQRVSRSEPILPTIAYEDVIGICTGIFRRSPSGT